MHRNIDELQYINEYNVFCWLKMNDEKSLMDCGNIKFLVLYLRVYIRYSPSASLHSRVLDMRALEILLALELRVEVLTLEMKDNP